MRRVMVLVLVALGCVLFTEAPAQACERPVPSVSKALRGRRSSSAAPSSKVTSAGDQTTYAVAVDRVYDGRVDESVMVTAPRTKADCGLTGVRPRRRGDVRDPRRQRRQFTTSSFEGSRALTPAVRAAVVRPSSAGQQAGAPGARPSRSPRSR